MFVLVVVVLLKLCHVVGLGDHDQDVEPEVPGQDSLGQGLQLWRPLLLSEPACPTFLRW